MVYYNQEKQRKNREKWTARMEGWKRSGLSGAAWRRKEDVTYCQFLYWKKRLLDEPVQKTQSFIEIEDGVDASGIEILIEGFLIRVSKDFDSATLSMCIRILRDARC